MTIKGPTISCHVISITHGNALRPHLKAVANSCTNSSRDRMPVCFLHPCLCSENWMNKFIQSYLSVWQNSFSFLQQWISAGLRTKAFISLSVWIPLRARCIDLRNVAHKHTHFSKKVIFENLIRFLLGDPAVAPPVILSCGVAHFYKLHWILSFSVSVPRQWRWYLYGVTLFTLSIDKEPWNK